jgi:hypothetical protein
MAARVLVACLAIGMAGLCASPARAQRIDENCTASIGNRTVQVNRNGTFAIPDIPVDTGSLRVRVVCRDPDGTTRGAQSEFIVLVPNGSNQVGPLKLGVIDPIPTRLEVTSYLNTFTTRGQTIQLSVRGVMPDGGVRDLTEGRRGTSYSSSNSDIATVSADGLVTGRRRGTAIISARNEGVLGAKVFTVLIPNDADDDGMTDEWENANGLNPNDASDAGQDLDDDGLSNLEEYRRGTNPRAADTDGDGLSDGDEIARGTNPLLADTDGDGLADGDEVRRGTNPLSPDTDGDGLTDGLEVQLGLNPLVPDATTTVEGRAVDSTGAPVSGASAIVLGLFATSSDPGGVFRIPVVPATLGPIRAVARIVRAGTVLDGESADVAPVPGGVTNVGTLQLGVTTGTVTGLVTSPQGQPVAGVQVTVTAGFDRRTTTTDVTGRYRVSNLTSGALVVTASQVSTGLRGRATGVLPVNGNATVDVRLGPSGTITGTVFQRDGVTPVGAGVAVALSGSVYQTATTDATGRFLFDFVPLSTFTVEASDAGGNRGRTTGSLTVTGQTAVANIGFLARGHVTGTIRDGAGEPVPNASITLSIGAIFGGTRTTTADANGAYSFLDVFIGPVTVTARNPITRLGGTTDATLLTEGQTLAVNVTLAASGRVAGTVTRTGGGTVEGLQVRLSNGLTTSTSSTGGYLFDIVPLGAYTVDVTDIATGDRGRGTGTVTGQDQTATVNVTMNGMGTVVVTVRDGGNALVENAQVTVRSDTQFGGQVQGVTQTDGTVTFPRILAGPYTVTATNPLTKLSGSATGSVAAGATQNTTVVLASSGTITGRVVGADGVTPVSAVILRLSGPTSRQVNNPPGGDFTFGILPIGTYALTAYDSLWNVLGTATNVTLTTNGQVVTRNVQLIGLGTVTGRVLYPDDSPATGVAVALRSDAPGFTRTLGATTDVTGTYSIPRVPIGPFVVTSSFRQGGEQFFGNTGGDVTADGQTVTADIALSASLVPSTVTLYDANNLAYNLRENGSIQDGTREVFQGSGGNRGGLVLEIVAGGTTVPFAGSVAAFSEEDGRERGIQQSNVAGLDVTRKIFVPRHGYFARYLEILRNPTSSPITVDVRLKSHYRFIQKLQNGFLFDREPRIIGTSSGDDVLDVTGVPPDVWVTFDDDEDLDPFQVNNLPSVAHVFGGVGDVAGSTPINWAAFTLDVPNRFGRLQKEWRGVTILPGQTVAFMHFVAEQLSRQGAQASAGRLAQLPPEALTGLSADEIAQIRNFAVPDGGMSTLSALPSLSGTVSGTVLASDALTVIPNAPVTFRSSSPYFGRLFSLTANHLGEYRLNPSFNDSGSSVAVPMDDYTVRATHPQTTVQSLPFTGFFEPGFVGSTQNIVFSNSGMVTGTVRRHNGAVVSGGSVVATGGALATGLSRTVGADGSYAFTGLAAGTYVLAATLPHPQGTALSAVTVSPVADGTTTQSDITFGPTGGVTGLVRLSGSVVVGAAMQLRVDGTTRSTSTNTGGSYTFTDVPSGTAVVEAVHQPTNTAASAAIEIVPDATVTQDLNLAVGGTVTGLVTNGGSPVSGALMTLTAANGDTTTTTGADGRYTFVQVPPGNVSVRAFSSALNLNGFASGSFGLSGQTLTLNISLLSSGIVTGTVFEAGTTTPVPGAAVTINRFLQGLPTTVTTDAQGQFTFTLVPLGTFTLDVTRPSTGDRGRATNQVNANGETRTVNVTLNGQGQVIVTVRDASSNPISGANVSVTSQTIFGGTQQGVTQADGTAAFERVLAGNFSASATEPATLLGGSTSGSVAVGGTTNALISLQAAGTVLGRVFDVGGVTPVSQATVRLYGTNFFRQTTSAGDGSFRFDGVLLRALTLDTFDSLGRVRARESLAVTENGEIVTRNLVFEGLGSVTGIVTIPGGAPAASASVQVRSTHPSIGGFFNTTTDTSGSYLVTGVPVGGVVVTATSSNQTLRGEVNAQITAHDQQITVNVGLLANTISLSGQVNRYDANDFLHNLVANGSIVDGTSSVFRGDFSANQNGFLLDIVSNGTPTRFTGSTVGRTEEGGHEIAITQANVVTGLDVTRKLFIPRNGYFARYLETLSNTTVNPITVGVRITTNFRSFNGVPRVITTSNGNAILDVSDPANPDRWAVIDDNTDNDPFLVSGVPAVGIVFDGPGAATRATQLNLTVPRLTHEWENVTIAPGQSVTFMHFGAQSTSRAGAQAAATRLVQLPPEALAGLDANEIEQIRNFAVPLDGVSLLDPILLNGSVTGRALEGDGATPVASMSVRYRSSNPIFGRQRSVATNATGNFTFLSTVANLGSSGNVAIPILPFTLDGNHPQSVLAAPVATGGFAPGATAAQQDLVFTGFGRITGGVVRHTGAALTNGGTIVVQGGVVNRTLAIGTNGTFSVGGLPPATYTLTGNASHPQGTALTGSISRRVTAGVATDVTIPVEATGNVTGVVVNAAGVPANGVQVRLTRSGFTRTTSTNAQGAFALNDLRLGPITLEAFEPNTSIASTAPIVVLQDQTVTQDLQLIGLGTVTVQVNRASGSPAGSAQVNIRRFGQSFYNFAGSTNASGQLTINNVPVGTFSLQVYHPDNTNIFVFQDGAVSAHAEVVPMTVTLPPTGVVTGRITFADGSPAFQAYAEIYRAQDQRFLGWSYSDSNGIYTIVQVQAAVPLLLRVYDPTFNYYREVEVTTLVNDGQTVTVDVTLPAIATVRVTVLRADSTPYGNAYVEIRKPNQSWYDGVGYTNANGVVDAPNVQEGTFTVRAYDGSTFANAGSATGVVTLADHGQIVPVTITAPVSGTVRGTIYAGDGETPIPDTYVEARDRDTGNWLRDDYTDEEGEYFFNTFQHGSGGFGVIAYSPNWDLSVEVGPFFFTSSGQELEVNITLPLAVAKGTVRFTDGEVSEYPSVWVTQLTSSGWRTFYGSSRENGTYTVVGMEPGITFTVFAQDGQTGLIGSAEGIVTAPDDVAVVDVTLPPSATLSGYVRYPNGAGVSWPWVVVSASNGFDRYVGGTNDGNYAFRHVPLGPFSLQACDYNTYPYICGVASGTIPQDDVEVVVDIILPELSTVAGVVYGTDGVTRVPGARVRIENFDYSGPNESRFYNEVDADSFGNYVMTGVPVGRVHVTAWAPGNQGVRGVASGDLGPGGTLVLDVTLGNAITFPVNLFGNDNFLYDVQCSGYLSDGGTVDRSLNDAYDGAYHLTIGTTFPCLVNATAELGARQVALGPAVLSGLTVTRKVFVPETGGFARYLEVLANNGTQPATRFVTVSSNLGSDGSTRIVVSPTATAFTYAVTDQNGFCCDPALAHVFAGPGALGVYSIQFLPNNDNINYTWEVTVEPGETVILMHFAVQRGVTDTAGAQAQAQALVNLTDPNALSGMTEQERAQVVNFQIP